ncbi:excalibur calcium-binding domain-containing protein [Pseudonocardia sp. RS11V-5]|uniref:excalibur calcium-binding domain-containing protein n=1 Tax=Pseudonocardia terrae TaxID=2905831 RepID=UPI001E62C46C|nr:excalibur calcium-binding domain-containing protein [Pseudonocardia terrae]MCE3554033.1 excalibur calcium-binding domain-containing protein [Pseudonocardia terrae]
MPTRAPARPLIRTAALLASVSAALLFGATAPAMAATVTCSDFTYEEDAQAALPLNPGLDGNHDGKACESLPGRGTTTPTTTPKPTPTTTTKPPKPTPSPTTPPSHDDHGTGDGNGSGSGSGRDDHGGKDDNGNRDDHHDGGWQDRDDHGDGNHDDAATDVTTDDDPTTVEEAADDTAVVTGDRDCADFATQAAAQAVLLADLSDPERLDADSDGIACEDHFGTEGRQVAVHPVGGVATGGAGLR